MFRDTGSIHQQDEYQDRHQDKKLCYLRPSSAIKKQRYKRIVPRSFCFGSTLKAMVKVGGAATSPWSWERVSVCFVDEQDIVEGAELPPVLSWTVLHRTYARSIYSQ